VLIGEEISCVRYVASQICSDDRSVEQEVEDSADICQGNFRVGLMGFAMSAKRLSLRRKCYCRLLCSAADDDGKGKGKGKGKEKGKGKGKCRFPSVMTNIKMTNIKMANIKRLRGVRLRSGVGRVPGLCTGAGRACGRGRAGRGAPGGCRTRAGGLCA